MLTKLCFQASLRLPLHRPPTLPYRSSLPSLHSPRSPPPRRHQHAKAVLRPNIAVVGGGHAGISAALRLSSLPWTRLTRPTITLVDRADRFCFLPMLYELALGQVEQWEIAPRFQDLLADTPVNFLHGDVENLDLGSGAVEGSRRGLTSGAPFRLHFDRLVLALGSSVGGVDKVQGAREFAIPFHRLEDAVRVKERLAQLSKAKGVGGVVNVVVVGGGYSGVEVASCVADELGTAASVMVVEPSDRLLPRGNDFNRQTSERALVQNGVVTVYGSRVTEVTKADVAVRKMGEDEGEGKEARYPADLVIWTAGVSANASVPNFGLPLDDKGLIETDKKLQVKGYEDRIYALGDAAAVEEGGAYAGTAQVATQQAEYAAWNAWASLTGNPKLEYRYAHLGEMMVLGRKDATVSTTVGLELDGTPAWAARRLAYLARMPTDRHRGRVAASWAANPLLKGMGDLVKESRKYRDSGL